ncbi:hypothetical protein [Haliangium sp.]
MYRPAAAARPVPGTGDGDREPRSRSPRARRSYVELGVGVVGFSLHGPQRRAQAELLTRERDGAHAPAPARPEPLWQRPLPLDLARRETALSRIVTTAALGKAP